MSQCQRILIIGAGFAGVWAALSAIRAIELAKHEDIEVTLIAPSPTMLMRIRLYESDLSQVAPSVEKLLEVVGVRFIHGYVKSISTSAHTIKYLPSTEDRGALPVTLEYTRLVLASGSDVFMPSAIRGLKKHAFTIDNLPDALKLEKHLLSLGNLPAAPARNTVIVAGGGFTGIEAATELPGRLAPILGDATAQVVLVEKADAVGPELGPGPRPVIIEALKQVGVQVYLGDGVASVDADGVTLSSGKRIEAKTVIWTVGVRASSLTEQIAGAERDESGRLAVDDNLKVIGVDDVYAAGDTCRARADDEGHFALMACQNAQFLGRTSGHNAVQDLLSLPRHIYRQPFYVTCLDLGGAGAVITYGWDRLHIHMVGEEAKEYKRQINRRLIYPPAADRTQALLLADPDLGYELKDGVLGYKVGGNAEALF